MKAVRTIETAIGKVILYENPSMMKTIFNPIKLESLKDAEEHLISSYTLLEGIQAPPDLVDIRELKGITKEIREYFGNNPLIKKHTVRSAILTSSGISKIVGNIYLRFSKPDFPTKLFTSEEKAVDWLFLKE